jgi:hypothetical protein
MDSGLSHAVEDISPASTKPASKPVIAARFRWVQSDALTVHDIPPPMRGGIGLFDLQSNMTHVSP